MDRCRQILLKYWGYSTFRPLQEDIIQSVIQGKDTLALMPTGGGKSVTFQVPALLNPGLCLVVTPLIALMKDQVENLQKKGIKALMLYSGMTRHEIEIAIESSLFDPEVKFLYLSPERLGTELFLANVERLKVNLLAIDEAHCISQWGYDFRPSYLKIAEIRDYLPNVPVLALTATATIEVVNDIQERLKFKQKNALKKSFERKNLVYLVRHTEDKLKYLLKICGKMPGTGVVYVRSRRQTMEIARFLKKNNISADFYNAGLSNQERDEKQARWKNNQTRVMVCTNAFGMGIDKPDVRFVAHLDLPDTLEAYFQEAGRGGRDEKTAYAVLLFHPSDRDQLEERLKTAFPEAAQIKRVYNALGNFFQLPVGLGQGNYYDFNIGNFCQSYNLDLLSTFNALKILEKEGFIELSEEIDNPSKIHILVGNDELYKFQIANEALDGFIKFLLRNYTGLFQNYVAIDEGQIARRSKVDEELVVKFLERLHLAGIIEYIKRKKTPTIFYPIERLEDKTVLLSKENYHWRKERFKAKMEAVLAYAETTTKCRSQFLLHYFGETDSARCGHCDVCLTRNELGMSKYEFDIILEKIKLKLRQSPLSLELLVDHCGTDEKKCLDVIRWLLDNNKITYNEQQQLAWKKAKEGL